MSQPCFRFDEFELDTESCELSRAGHYVKAERIPLQLLILLLENPGKLVRRETIVERLWGDNVFVEAEHSINTAVNKLRAILGDDSRNPRFVRTVVGQGYCFIAKVKVLEPVAAGAPAITTAVAERSVAELPASNGHVSVVEVEDELGADVTTAMVEAEKPLQETVTVTVQKPLNSRRWVIAGVAASLVLVIVALAMYLSRRQGKTTQSVQEVPVLHSVAVLPFRNLAQSSAQDYLADGMTDQIITDLARSTSLRVISRRSAMQYKGIPKPIQEIAQALHVDAIIEGSYLRAGKQVHITAQLLDARNDRHLWAQSYDESDRDLLAVQDQVASDIAQQTAIVLGSGFTRAKVRTVNPQARDAYLRGRFLWNARTPAAITNSIKYYTEAIRDDPSYADAYVALAEAYVLLGVYGAPNPADDLWKAQYAAERALDLDSSLGEAHTALGAVKIERDWDWAGAENEYRKALELAPADATTHHWYSLHLSRMGKTQEAEAEIQRAIALDPLSLMINTDAAITAYWARNPREALVRVDNVLMLSANFAEAHLAKGKILEQMHEYPQAIAEYEQAKKLFGGELFVDALKAHAMAMSGEREDALRIVKELEAAPPQAHVTGSDLAVAYCALGQRDDAMMWLNRAYEKHEKGLGLIGIDPLFDGCRDDARFKEVLAKLNLVSRPEDAMR